VERLALPGEESSPWHSSCEAHCIVYRVSCIVLLYSTVLGLGLAHVRRYVSHKAVLFALVDFAGVRRLICVEPGSRRVEGIISLSDIMRFLLS